MRTLSRFAAVAALCLCLSACASKVTKDNFNKIKNGMSETQVTSLLGSPTNAFDMMGMKSAVWKDGDNIIAVTFKDGKVMVAQFVNAQEMNMAATNPPAGFPMGAPQMGGNANHRFKR